MGCATSKNENKANKDVCERRKIFNLPSKEKQKKLMRSQTLKKKKT